MVSRYKTHFYALLKKKNENDFLQVREANPKGIFIVIESILFILEFSFILIEEKVIFLLRYRARKQNGEIETKYVQDKMELFMCASYYRIDRLLCMPIGYSPIACSIFISILGRPHQTATLVRIACN